ncbi:MAG: WG repeat-containing protein [Deltaproteobacteria bacterium]
MNKKLLTLLLSTCLIFSCYPISMAQQQTVSAQALISSQPNSSEIGLYPAYIMENNNQKWGYIDKTGTFVIQPLFDGADDFQSNGLAKVYVKNADKVNQGIINKSGKFILQPIYSYISNFSDGVTIAQSDKYSIVNEEGKKIFETNSSIYNFNQGLATLIQEAGGKTLYGYINKDGKIVIKPQFQYAKDFENGKAIVITADDKTAVIDKTGTIIKTFDYKIDAINQDIAVFYDKNKDKYGYTDLKGNILIEPKYTQANPFEEGYAVVNNAQESYDNEFGLIDSNGKFIIEPKYNYIKRIGKDLYAVSLSDKDISWADASYCKKALFNIAGKQLTDFNYYEVTDVENGLISVSDAQKTYFINTQGQKVTGLPETDGYGALKIKGDIVVGNFDQDIIYLTKDGKTIWKSEKIYALDNGAKVVSKKYRTGRFILVRYPIIENLKGKSLQDALNKKFKEIFIGNRGIDEDTDIYVSYNIEQNKDLLILSLNGYDWPLGAAHGMPYTSYYYINLKNGSFYKYEDLFNKNSKYKEKIEKILTKKIPEWQKEKGLSSWSQNSYSTEGCGFIITKDSLQIYYTPYEIAPYCEGFPTFDIPYYEILDVIDTNGEFWKSFNKNINTKKQMYNKDESVKVINGYIEKVISNYENSMIQAINKNNFGLVQPYLVQGSNLYNSQKSLVANLYKKGIKEKVVECSISDFGWNTDRTEFKVYVNEKIAIKYPGKDFQTKKFSWVYTVKYLKGKYLLSDIEK